MGNGDQTNTGFGEEGIISIGGGHSYDDYGHMTFKSYSVSGSAGLELLPIGSFSTAKTYSINLFSWGSEGVNFGK